MVAPIVIGGVVVAARVAGAAFSYVAPMAVRAAQFLLPKAAQAVGSAASAAPGVASAAAGAATSVGARVLGAAGSVGSAAAGAAVSGAKAAPKFALDVLKSAAGFGGGVGAATTFAGQLGGMAASGLGSLAKYGTVLAALYYAAQYVKNYVGESFFGKDAMEAAKRDHAQGKGYDPASGKAMTAAERQGAGLRADARYADVSVNVRSASGKTVSFGVPRLPGETDDVALDRAREFVDRQSAEGKMQRPGPGSTLLVGRGDGVRGLVVGADGRYAEASAADIARTRQDQGPGFGPGQPNFAGREVGGAAVSDPVRLGAISSVMSGTPLAAPGSDPLAGSKVREFDAGSFKGVAVGRPDGGSIALAASPQGAAVFTSSTERGRGLGDIERTVTVDAGRSMSVGGDGRLNFERTPGSARELSQAVDKAGRIGSSGDSVTDALKGSSRLAGGEVMVNSGRDPVAMAKFQAIGPDGSQTKASMAFSEGRATMSVMDASGSRPIASKSFRDPGFSFDQNGKPAFSGRALEMTNAFAKDPRGEMRQMNQMTREDGGLSAMLRPSVSEQGAAAAPVRALAGGMEM